jgi:hypothetical protein
VSSHGDWVAAEPRDVGTAIEQFLVEVSAVA